MWTYREIVVRSTRLQCASTHLACRSLAYNLDTQSSSPLDARTNTHHQPDSIQILHTTNTQAYALNCTHARIHRHLLSYKGHEANVCKRSRAFLGLLDGLEAVLVAENSGQTVLYGEVDSAGAQADTPTV